MNARNRDSCCQLFTKLKIRPLKLQYIFSLLLLIAKSKKSLNFELYFLEIMFIC